MPDIRGDITITGANCDVTFKLKADVPMKAIATPDATGKTVGEIIKGVIEKLPQTSAAKVVHAELQEKTERIGKLERQAQSMAEEIGELKAVLDKDSAAAQETEADPPNEPDPEPKPEPKKKKSKKTSSK